MKPYLATVNTTWGMHIWNEPKDEVNKSTMLEPGAILVVTDVVIDGMARVLSPTFGMGWISASSVRQYLKVM